ncbi:two-component system, cell cycle sensor histidine kinase PleC [Azospirillaceae bacterium]
MMSFTKGLSTKFVIALIVPMVVCAALYAGIASWIQYREGMEILHKEAAIKADSLAIALTVPLWNFDRESASGILRMLEVDRSALCATIMDRNQTQFVRKGNCDRTEQKVIELKREIEFKTARLTHHLGTLHLVYSLRALTENTWRQTWNQIALTVLQLLVMSIVAIVAHRVTIGNPLLRFMESVKQSRVERRRVSVNWQSEDELGQLIAAYNTLLTEQERDEIKLRENEALFRMVAETAPYSLVLTRLDDHSIIAANHRAVEMLSVSGAEIIGQTAFNYYSDPNDRMLLIDRVREQGVVRDLELHLRDDGGRSFWGLVSASMVVINGVPALIAGFVDISERRKMEEDLAASERRFRDLIEGSVQGVCIHREFKPLFANDACARILGLSSVEEVLAIATLLDFFPSVDHIELMEQHYRLLSGKGGRPANRMEIVQRDGTPIWVSALYRLVHWRGQPAVQVTVMDVTERVRTERELEQGRALLEARSRELAGLVETLGEARRQEAEARQRAEAARLFLETLLDTIPNPIFYKDVDYRYRGCNAAFEQLSGWTRQKLVGLSTFDISHSALAGLHDDVDRRLLEGRERVWVYEAPIRDSKDNSHDVIFSKAVYNNPDGTVAGVVGVMVDITDRKRMEKELVQAMRAAEEANRSKSEFLAMMSHELRTPLNAVLGFSEMIRDQSLGPIGQLKYAEFAGDVHAGGLHLLSLINDILDLSKIEANQMGIYPEPIALGGFSENCLTLVRGLARSRKLELVMAGSLPGVVLWADVRAAKQMVVNLLSNACKFTPEGGRVELSFQEENNRGVVIIVTDTGIGMTSSGIRKALEKFGQIDNLLTRNQQGSGLGLPLVKGLIDLHGGRLEIESSPGCGTTVRLFFPARSDVFEN